MKWGEWTAVESRIEVARKMLPGNHMIGIQINKPDEAIDKARRNFHKTYFNEITTRKGFRALEMYKFEDFSKRRSIKSLIDKVDKDDYSHGSDAFVLSEVMGDIRLNFKQNFNLINKNNYFSSKDQFNIYKNNLRKWYRS